MSIWVYILGMSICLVFSVAALGSILITIDPYQASFLAKILFFICLFFVIASSISLLGIYCKRKSKRLFKTATRAFLAGVLIAGFLNGGLILWKLIKNLI